MKTIVVNTLTGAVSEYGNFKFDSVSVNRYAGLNGFFACCGDTDAGDVIASELRLPVVLRENTLKKHMDMVYLSMRGRGSALFTVYGPDEQAWPYLFELRESGVSRCQPGKGIRQNYFGFGLSTPNGQPFTLDRIEVKDVTSKTRRI